MQQHARPARTQNDRHGSGGCIHRLDIHQRLTNRFTHITERPHLAADRVKEIVITKTTTTTRTAAFATAIAFNQDAAVEAHQRANIRTQGAIGRRHQHLFVDTGQGGDDLSDRRIQSPGETVHLFQQSDLLLLIQSPQGIDRCIQSGSMARLPDADLAITPTLRYATGGDHRLAQRMDTDLVRVGKTGLLAAHGAHTNSLIDVVTAILDDAIFQHPGLVIAALEIEITKVHAMTHDLPQHARQYRFIQFMG